MTKERNRTMKKQYLLAAVATLCMPALAFGVAWSNPAGSCDDFDWANGQNATDEFGSPSNIGNILLFSTGFDVTAPPGSPVSESDQMDVDLTAHAGLEFSAISLTVYGDYSITDNGSPGGNSVEANFGVAASDNLSAHGDLPKSDAFAFERSEATAGRVYWDDNASFTIDIYQGNATDIHVTVNGEVIAISDGESGSTATITAN